MKPKDARKRLHLGRSFAYGWRLTRKHFATLVPGAVVFYLPELLGQWGWDHAGWGWAISVWHSAVACWLLWHALQLSDKETRSSRFHEPILPAPGYLKRFVASTGLYWMVMLLGLWPALRLAGGGWDPRAAAAGWLWRPWLWDAGQAGLAAKVLLAAFPAGLWTVYGWFHGYYVADEGQDAWPSMVSSFHAVRGAFWPTLWFLCVVAAVNAAGYALWVVGVFVAFPVTLMATTYAHLELKQQTRGGKK
jgi:hypothetical protein